MPKTPEEMKRLLPGEKARGCKIVGCLTPVTPLE
jgi:hypothetical protein